MATRLVVLVLFHARSALCALGLSVLVSLPANAGTDEWTLGVTRSPCFLAGQPDIASAVSCQAGDLLQYDLGGGSSGAVCPPHYTNVTGTAPNFTGEIRIYYDGIAPYDCAARALGGPGYWSFTESMDCDYQTDIHGCYVEPPPPPDCSAFDGVQVDRFYADMGVGGPICASPPGEEVMDCEALVAAPSGFAACAGGECFARLEFTGDQCGAEPDATAEVLEDEPGNTNCVSGDGVTVCAAQNSQNCGTVNGQSVCLDTIPPGRCTFLGNGGMVCASDADAPPAPTDGGGMDPATPDGSFTGASDDAEEQDFNYFGPGTVASSGTPTSGSGQTGTGESPDETEEPCMEVGSCPGALPELGEATSFADATNAFMAGVESAPLIAAASGLGASLPAGECPAPSATLDYIGGLELTLDAHCGLWDEIASVLAAVMLAVWVFVGARILLSA